jgi:hypothetical protein
MKKYLGMTNEDIALNRETLEQERQHLASVEYKADKVKTNGNPYITQ